MSEPKCSCRGSQRIDERTDGGTATTDGEATSVLERRIPGELGALMATAYGLDAEPETLDDWVDALRSWARAQDVWPPDFDDLCHVDGSRHVLTVDGETHAFACVLDALMAPALLDRTDLVVRSTSPVEGAELEVRIADGEIEVTPSTTVASLGASRTVDRLDADEFAPEAALTQLCAHGNAFPNRTTYEAWAEETPEAATMAIPMNHAFELASEIVREEIRRVSYDN